MDRSTDLWTFGRGDNFHLQEYLGAHKETRGEQEGFTFRVWAPNAQAVDLIGDFTDWEARKIPMVRNEAVSYTHLDVYKRQDHTSTL